MRHVLASGLAMGLSCLLFIPACASPLGGGIGQGFESGLGWGLCTAIGKGVVKAAHAIKGRNHKSESTQSADNQPMGPEDYYNRGMEEGYARAREEGSRYGTGSRYGADDRYQEGQDNKYADARDGSRNRTVEQRVYARRLTVNPAQDLQQSKGRRSRRRAQPNLRSGQSTIAARQKTATKVANHPQNNSVRTANNSKQKVVDLASKP